MPKHVAAHVPEEVYEVWKAEADEMGASMSEFMKMMTAAGRKKFSREVEPDEDNAELRAQRNDLRNELHKTRNRVSTLEQQFSNTERNDIIDYVEGNPGARREDIIQRLINTMNGRATKLMAEMEGAEIRIDSEGRYYTGDRVEVSRD